MPDSLTIPATWPEQLAGGLSAMGQRLSATQTDQSLRYLALLARWNRSFNLTAVRDPAHMVSRQLLDSLSLLPWLRAGPILDLGSGPGLPGIPLAIARPDLHFTLLDSNGKKTRFMRQATAELRLSNVEVVQSRVERLARHAYYSAIISRAFAALPEMVALSESLLLPGGLWLALKGAYPTAEIDSLPAEIDAECLALRVPGEVAQRHLVVMQRRGAGDCMG